MPIYQFKCDNCSHEFEKRMGYHDKSPKKCPECKRFKLNKIYSAPYVFDSAPKTLGSIADKNDSKIGRYTKDRNARRAKKSFETPKDPWWRKGPIKKQLVEASKKEKTDYIKTGKLPAKLDRGNK